jgi:eukaryotic-like serine/threonine-protein kinase
MSDPFEGTSYRAVLRLGGGGTGDVFIVEHQQLGRRFAAKVLRADLAQNAQLVDRMRLEAQALGRLKHPNIVAPVDFARTTDGRPFVVTELLQGQTLAQALENRGAMPVTAAVACAMALLAALEATHGLGLVHHAVKPNNVFLATQHDGSFKLKLIDFGIAPYSNAETAMGGRGDARADVHAAALVLYAMLAGRGPFDDVHGSQALGAVHSRQRPKPPSVFARDPVPAELDELVLRALDKDPNARFATAAELRVRLADVADRLARPAGWLETTVFSRDRDTKVIAPTESDPSGDFPALPRQAAKAGAPAWIVFTVGVVIAALAVAALGALFGGSR